MNTIKSYQDYDTILNIINNSYPVKCKEIYLHRDMGGVVYFVISNEERYVFKIFRSVHTENALQSIQIMSYLGEQQYPVVPIIQTNSGERYITTYIDGMSCIAVLYSFIIGEDIGFLHNACDGDKLNIYSDIDKIGYQIGILHKTMVGYNKPLITRDKEFFIDRFITLLRRDAYDSSRIDKFEQYGQELWNRMKHLPGGFCHGDLHTGNMIQTKEGYVLFDFDISSFAYPLIDVATLCDATNFNIFDEGGYDRTARVFEKFYKGYSQVRILSDNEISAIYDFIPIRHMELFATILNTHEQKITIDGIDEQYDWMNRWDKLCSRKRKFR